VALSHRGNRMNERPPSRAMGRFGALAGLAGAAMLAAGCGSSSPSKPATSSTPPASATSASPSATASSGAASSGAASGTALKTTKIGGVTVLTNAKGFTLYWFAPDTSTKSNCNASCTTVWPPVAGPATAGAGVTGKLATIKRSDGSTQATYNGHPLYTYVGDSAPGQAKGNGLTLSGGLWHEVTASGATAPASSRSTSSGTGGY
jgi:predicted lipoprotein with Yx(FWY)xxD motif